MAFADPQTVTISGTGYTCNRVGSGDGVGSFMTSDGNLKLSLSNTYGRRNRRVMRFDHRKVAADPLNAAQNLNYSFGFWLVVDAPPIGYTVAEQKAVIDGALANAQASTGANITKWLGGEA